VVQCGFKELVARKIHAPVVTRNISVVAKRDRTLSVAAKTFIETMQAYLARPRA